MRLLHSLFDGTIAVRILEESKAIGVCNICVVLHLALWDVVLKKVFRKGKVLFLKDSVGNKSSGKVTGFS